MNSITLLPAMTAAAPVPKATAKPYSFTVTPHADTLTCGDPLYFVVRFANTSTEDIKVPPTFEFRDGLYVEIAGPDAKEFTIPKPAVTTSGCGVSGAKRTRTSPPGEELRWFGYVCYDGAKRDDAFHTPGTWRVRARFTVEDNTYYSDVVKVEVGKRAKTSDDLKRLSGYVDSALYSSGCLDEEEATRLKAAAEVLGESSVTTTTHRLLMWRDLHNAKTPNDVEQAMAEYRKQREKRMSAVEKEYLDLKTAKVLLSREDVGRAEEVINAIKEPSVDLTRLKARLDGLKPRR